MLPISITYASTVKMMSKCVFAYCNNTPIGRSTANNHAERRLVGVFIVCHLDLEIASKKSMIYIDGLAQDWRICIA